MSPVGVRIARRRPPVAGGHVGRRPPGRRRDAGAGRDQTLELFPSIVEGPGGEPTLDDVLAGAWEGLAARSVVPCPVCGDDMVPVESAGAAGIAGRCQGCGTTFS